MSIQNREIIEEPEPGVQPARERKLEMPDSVEVVRRLFKAADERDIDPMFEIYDPSVVIREAASLPYGGDYRGHEGVVQHGLGYVGTWEPVQRAEDRPLEPDLFMGSGEYVCVRWRQRARSSTGEQLDSPAVSVFRVRDGMVVESQMFHFDTVAVLRFLSEAGESSGPRP